MLIAFAKLQGYEEDQLEKLEEALARAKLFRALKLKMKQWKYAINPRAPWIVNCCCP